MKNKYIRRMVIFIFALIIVAAVKAAETASFSDSSTFQGNYVVLAAFTLILYESPVIIYRYAVKKEPLETVIALIITISYASAVCVLLEMLSLHYKNSLSGLVVICSLINFPILTAGYKKNKQERRWEEEELAELEQQDAMLDDGFDYSIPDKSKFCTCCGAEITEDGCYCVRCGAAIEREGSWGPGGENDGFDYSLPESLKRICPSCKAEVEQNDAYCKSCGAVVLTQQSSVKER